MPSSATGPPADRTVPPTMTGKGKTVRIRGTVSEGVEAGCTLLTSKGVVYLLIWRHGTPDTGLKAELEVEGTIQPDLLTTCQQGTPLMVERVISS